MRGSSATRAAWRSTSRAPSTTHRRNSGRPRWAKQWRPDPSPQPGRRSLVPRRRAYHAGAAVYDGLTGDRDGAITHGVQGAVSAAAAIPGVGEVLGKVDMGLGLAGGAARTVGMETGNEALKDTPQSTADALAAQAVYMTNAVFGKDDTNWFAPGDEPTGNRRGEIGAGVTNMVLGLPGLLLPDSDRQAVGDAVGGFFGVPEGAPTSGAESRSSAQRVGQADHERLGSFGKTIGDAGSAASHAIQDIFAGRF